MYVSYQLLINDLFLVGTLDSYSNGTWFDSAQIAKMFELFLFFFTYNLDNFLNPSPYTIRVVTDSTYFVKDYIRLKVASQWYDLAFCSIDDLYRGFYQCKMQRAVYSPNYFCVKSVFSPLNVNPLRQSVFKYSLPDSCIPESILEGFRLEDEARLLDLGWQDRVSRQVNRESIVYEREPFFASRARFVRRYIDGRLALFDRRYSLTEPAYAPLFCINNTRF